MKNTLKYIQTIWTRLTTTNQKATDNTSQDGEEATKPDSSNQITSNEPITNTPFRVIGNPEKGYFLALGIHRITDFKPSRSDAKDLLITNQWEIIINTITTVIHAINLEREQQKNNTK